MNRLLVIVFACFFFSFVLPETAVSNEVTRYMVESRTIGSRVEVEVRDPAGAVVAGIAFKIDRRKVTNLNLNGLEHPEKLTGNVLQTEVNEFRRSQKDRGFGLSDSEISRHMARYVHGIITTP